MKVASQCGEKTARRLCFFGLRWALLASALLSLAACKDDNYSLGDQAPLADCTLVGPAPSEQLQKTARPTAGATTVSVSWAMRASSLTWNHRRRSKA